ncbi:MAG: FHA domain-containing protein [Oligoflexia bacterium]|nr:FHA domain-containing protein [Oligoflexia bacterium]
MTSAALLKTNNEIGLNIVAGRDKGVCYKLLGQTIRIGRATDNDVVLDDVKSSRYHARVEKREQNYWIVDAGSQNGIIVNGNLVNEKLLTLGDQIIIGNTTLIYGPPAPVFSKTPSLSLVQGGFSVSTKNANGKLVLIVIACIIGGFFILKNNSANKKQFKITDETALNAELETLESFNNAKQMEIAKKGKDTQQYSEAQAFYLKGFREFRESNFSRAIQFFEAALALYPEHPLAKRYLSRSRLKLNEQITSSLERGEKYFQTQKYSQAANEYRTVLLLVNDLNNKNAQLAQKRLESINLILINNR